jgi:hypothetical protein
MLGPWLTRLFNQFEVKGLNLWISFFSPLFWCYQFFLASSLSLITLAGAFLAAGATDNTMASWLGGAAVACATVNVIGGYLVTDRMLGMFKSKRGNQS